MNSPGSPLIEIENVGKIYPGGVNALEGVSLSLRAGEIHALIGENGAGKTTLATIAAGKLEASSGTVRTSGKVGMVHQHFELVGRLRVWENIVLGMEPRRGLLLDARRAKERVRELSARSGLEVDPDAVVEELPVGVAQRVELLRELAREPTSLLLDEPTAVLAPSEIEALFAVLTALARGGMGIIIITHKLQEVIAHADRITVLRNGRVVNASLTKDTSAEQIAAAMVGAGLPPLAHRSDVASTPGLVVEALNSGIGAHALHELSFEARRGEIVGIAGVEGNGQTALADAIAGVAAYQGSILFDGRALPPLRPGTRLSAGIRVIPQDRDREALIPSWSILENVALGFQRSFARGLLMDQTALRASAAGIVEHFGVRAASLDASIASLSGGNRQKIAVGRALEPNSGKAPTFVLAYQPTRGIDIGAANVVRSRLIEARNAGVAILLISFDLDELLELADRMLVMYRGRIVARLTREAFERERIGTLMAGAA